MQKTIISIFFHHSRFLEQVIHIDTKPVVNNIMYYIMYYTHEAYFYVNYITRCVFNTHNMCINHGKELRPIVCTLLYDFEVIKNNEVLSHTFKF